MSTRQKTGGALPINLFSGSVPGAGTVIYPVTALQVLGLAAMNSLSLQSAFTYGSGGTSVDVYLQTSLDKGITWFDIMNHHLLLATAFKLSSVNMFPSTPFTAGTTPGDGALAANTVLNGILGDRIRAKVVIVGTYAGTTLALDIIAKP